MISLTAYPQAPGMVIKPASGAGTAILDPDGDGYVSQRTNGIQVGFTNPPDNDVVQSEIPYVALVRPDIQGDLERGPTGGFTEIVGTDAAGNNAILTYSDNNYLYYRFRLSGYAPNSKSYSILIDTDQKFGFTGLNADPNAVVGNPGFEAEIVLETNFDVYAFNVDGSASRPATPETSALYDTNCQKSMAISNAGGDPDYFYDFFLPYPTALFTRTTPLRYVAITSMNPMPAIGNNAVSDLGGVGDVGDLDQAFLDLVNEQTPTVPGEEVLERTACPTINPVALSDATISGTTEGANTIINVSVYQSNGTTLIASGTTTTTESNWSINVSALSPAVTLTSGYKVKAKATALGKGVSYDNCDIETVTDCSGATAVPTVSEFSRISGGKGITVTLARPSGTKVYLYNSDYTLFSGTFKNGITNPYTITTNNQSFSFEFQGGQSFPDGVYYFQFQEQGMCISPMYTSCLYATGGTSAIPTISTTSITTTSTALSGNGTAASSLISIYADDNLIASTQSAATAPYAWTVNVSNLVKCEVITARQTTGGTLCLSNPTAGITVTSQAAKPTILTTGCFGSPGTITGTSTEIGATITLYKTSPSTSTLGTATVGSNGSWSVNNLTLNNGEVIAAAVTSGAAGTCITASVNSTPVTISTQTNISNYTIAFDPVTEKQTSVSGSISGGTYPVTLKLYVDETFIGTATVINSAGNWTVSGLNSFDLAVGSMVQATITGTGCESALSSTFATVQCLTPLVPSYSGGSKSYCEGGTGVVSLTTSEIGVIYQLVNASGVAQGLPVSGTGLGINLYTSIISAPLTGLYVKAYKIGNNACAVISGTVINFDIENPSPTVTFSSTGLSVEKGTTSVSLPYTAKSVTPSADNYTIDYSLAANNQGFIDVTVPAAVPGSAIALAVPAAANVGTYSGTITIYSANASACTTSYSFSITVYQAGTAPVISVQPVNKTICSGQTSTLSVSASGTVTGYQWQSATSYSGTYTNVGANSASYTTTALAATAYYRVIVSNTYGSVTSNVVTVTVTPAVSGTGTISGTPTVCAGQNGLNYSVSGISNATSYTWTYTGTGAFINGTGNSVYINFSTIATSGTLSVTGTNSCGSGTAASYVISVNPLPTVSAGVGITTCSNSGAVNITSGASASNYNAVTWTSSGTGTFSNANSLTDATYAPSATDIGAGSVTLTLTATSNGGCSTVTSTKTLTISAAPVATAGSDISTCTGTSTITMTGATATGTYTGNPVWSGGTGSGTWVQNANAALATFTPSAASGSFTATLTLTGCSNVTSSRLITWGTAPTPTYTVAPTSNSCIGYQVTYTTESGQNNYTWSIPGILNSDYTIIAGSAASNSITIQWLTDGSKTVTVNYTNAAGCLGNAAASNTITVNALPNPSEIIIH